MIRPLRPRQETWRYVLNIVIVGGLVTWLGNGNRSYGQAGEDQIVRQSSTVLQEVMAIPLREIPESLLADAHGIAIVPKVLKGSLVIGARHGNGVLLVRDERGAWRPPVFVTLSGGNVGWQVGVQSTDVVLVFRTPESVQGIMSGKFTVGADAAVAAGPIGRQASAATDARLGAEILSYSRSRGLFAGVSLDGTVLTIDQGANATYYPRTSLDQPAKIPPAAAELVRQVARSTQTEVGSLGDSPESKGDDSDLFPPTTGFSPGSAVDQAPSQEPKGDTRGQELASLRGQLMRSLAHLHRIVDPAWRSYLMLPSDFDADQPLSAESMERCLARCETVRRDPRYHPLTDRPEFQTAYAYLHQYVALGRHERGALQLPPPPVPAQGS